MKPVIAFVGQIDRQEEMQWIKALSARLPNEKILPFADMTSEARAAAQIAIVANPDPEDISELSDLVWIHSVWAGVERLVSDLSDRPFEIVRLVDPELARTMAEAVLAWSLYLHRDMPAYARQQRNQEWRELPYVEASQRSIGILGLGKLGAASAKALLDVGFNVKGWSRSLKQIDGVVTFSGSDGLSEMVKSSDILVNLLPLTPETSGLVDAKLLSKLPKDSRLINFGRGAVVVTDDLINALDREDMSHAVLDVFDQEPLPKDNPLWGHEKVTVLPHISAPTNMETAADIVADNIENYRQNGTLPPTVNKVQGY